MGLESSPGHSLSGGMENLFRNCFQFFLGTFSTFGAQNEVFLKKKKGSGILDPGSGILDPRPGSWILDLGSWIWDPGSRILVSFLIPSFLPSWTS